MTTTTIRLAAALPQSSSKSTSSGASAIVEIYADARAGLFGRGLRAVADDLAKLDGELEVGEKAGSVPTIDQVERMTKASRYLGEAAYWAIALGSEYTYFVLVLDEARGDTAKLARRLEALVTAKEPLGAGWAAALDKSVATARDCAKWLPFDAPVGLAAFHGDFMGPRLRALLGQLTKLDAELTAGERTAGVPTRDQANRLDQAAKTLAELAKATMELGHEWVPIASKLNDSGHFVRARAKELHAMVDKGTPFGAGWHEALDTPIQTTRDSASWLSF